MTKLVHCLSTSLWALSQGARAWYTYFYDRLSADIEVITRPRRV